MEPEKTIDIQHEPEVVDERPTPVKSAKNPKRVEAGKKMAAHHKKAKEKMLEDIAEANANANEAMSTLKSYLEQRSQPEKEVGKLQKYQTPIIVSGALLLAGLYLWTTREVKQSAPTPPPQRFEQGHNVDVQGHDNIYAI